MPTITETPATGYAFCRNARCPGYAMQEIEAVREEQSFTFGELGGDGIFAAMIERSLVVFRAANEDALPCPACGEPREVSGQPRPQYQPLSGHDPMGLLNVPKFDPNATIPPGEMTPTPNLLDETDEEIEKRIEKKLREEQIETRLRRKMQPPEEAEFE